MIEFGFAQTAEEREAIYRFRYSVYVEEMGRYRGRADHEHQRLEDPEDEYSWHTYAREGDEILASTRLTWGGNGFSERQIEQYGIAPFLAEIPIEHLMVGERTMVAPAWRGTDVFTRLGEETAAWQDDYDVRVVFGACEPHLISFYGLWQRPFGTRNINSPESGYLIPLVCFPQGEEILLEFGDGTRLPRCVEDVLAGTGTVYSPMLSDADQYVASVADALRPLSAPVFEAFTSEELEHCIARSNVITCAEGDRVLKKGGAARNMFVVLDGSLEVSDDDHPIAVLLPGDVFGETAFLLRCSRTFDVDVLADDTRILSLSERTLRKLSEEDPVIAAKLYENLSKIVCRRNSAPKPA
jgi:hypothetical protein